MSSARISPRATADSCSIASSISPQEWRHSSRLAGPLRETPTASGGATATMNESGTTKGIRRGAGARLSGPLPTARVRAPECQGLYQTWGDVASL
jgi:hypothetical protein